MKDAHIYISFQIVLTNLSLLYLLCNPYIWILTYLQFWFPQEMKEVRNILLRWDVYRIFYSICYVWRFMQNKLWIFNYAMSNKLKTLLLVSPKCRNRSSTPKSGTVQWSWPFWDIKTCLTLLCGKPADIWSPN